MIKNFIEFWCSNRLAALNNALTMFNMLSAEKLIFFCFLYHINQGFR